ncbi:glycoside hydrolase family 28 protein [Sutcliffiella horikoshii]|uniref:glycoside hydrolase family 28 protein n=1 Tax=Sutcliffiella horikoshii TaxID=79883 RepID=UPI001F4226EB|nr:glycoside hydrolase family 28 protein [Sutcliffiella horikoshii]MCG1021852.1 glycoside hydrolase family 28 protein [Sutcliffiella horikoshii]
MMNSNGGDVKAVTIIFRDVEYDIREYGAIGDGKTSNTIAINQAIEECAAEGGGTVKIPAGIWLTGPIRLKSNITLYLEDGATILFSKNIEEYPLIYSSFEGKQVVRCQSPLDAEDVVNVSIIGNGIFDGSGDAWRPVKKFKMTDFQWSQLIQSSGVIDKEQEIWWPSEGALEGSKAVARLEQKGSKDIEEYQKYKHFLRPNMVSFRKSKDILIDGPTFQNSPAWCIHPWLCENVTIRNIVVKNPWYSQNGDGLDLESCKGANVENCTFDVGDDAICLKSGKDEEGRRLATPCENITIKNCKVYSGHGGFVIGSEMSGGVRNVKITDCTFFGTDTGLRFKSTRGRGGIVEDIVVDNIKMVGIKNEAIVFHMFYELTEDEIKKNIAFSDETPIFRDITIQNITCSGAKRAILLKGLPEKPLQNLLFKDIYIKAKYGIYGSNVHNTDFSNVEVDVLLGNPFELEDCQGVTRR